jgi:hypothetical protein
LSDLGLEGMVSNQINGPFEQVLKEKFQIHIVIESGRAFEFD